MYDFSPKSFESKLQPFWCFSAYLLWMRMFSLGYVVMSFILYWWRQIPLKQKSKGATWLQPWLGASLQMVWSRPSFLRISFLSPQPLGKTWVLMRRRPPAFKSQLGEQNFLPSTLDSLVSLMFWIYDVLTEWQATLQFHQLFGLHQTVSLNTRLHFCIQTVLALQTVDCLSLEKKGLLIQAPFSPSLSLFSSACTLFGRLGLCQKLALACYQ